MSSNRRSGILYLKIDNVLYSCKVDSIKYSIGPIKNEVLLDSAGGVFGWKGSAQVPYIEGEIYDYTELDLKKFFAMDGSNATLQLANGKVFNLYQACYVGNGEVATGDAAITFRLEGKTAAETK